MASRKVLSSGPDGALIDHGANRARVPRCAHGTTRPARSRAWFDAASKNGAPSVAAAGRAGRAGRASRRFCCRLAFSPRYAGEGWRSRHFWRGPRNGPKVYELWVESRILLELATEDMMANYTKTWQVDAMTTLMGRVAV